MRFGLCRMQYQSSILILRLPDSLASDLSHLIDEKNAADGNDKEKDTHTVETNVRGQDVIYGQPMYYWYIPEHNLIASVKFPHSLADSEGVSHYIKKCIDLRIDHPRKKLTENTIFNHHFNK